MIRAWLKRKFFCDHEHAKRFYGGLYADEEGGAKYLHEMWWECDCGHVIGKESKKRARWAERMCVTAIIPERICYKDTGEIPL